MLMELVKAFARWWPCACLKCVSGLRSPEKSLNFFSEINIRLWHGAHRLLRHKLLKLDAASLLLRYIDRYSCLCCWNEFFQLCFRFCTEVFSNCIFEKTFAIGFQKGFDHKRIEFGVSSSNCGLICWSWIWMDWKIQEMLKPMSHLTTWSLSDN